MPSRREAAVVIAIFKTPPHGVIFVERGAHLRDHPGQIGLPGGRVHPEDAGLEVTALRELQEEVGIEPERVTIVGRLPMLRQQVTNNFDVTPFVAVVTPGALVVDGNETAGAFLVPLDSIVTHGVRKGRIEFGGLHLPSLVLDYEGRRIWGLTARILKSFVQRWESELRAGVAPHLET